MIYQYRPTRGRDVSLGGRIRSVGRVPVGTVVRVRGRKLIVDAWLPRDYTTVEHVNGRSRFVAKRIAGGHLALVRDLATGRSAPLSDAWLVDADAC